MNVHGHAPAALLPGKKPDAWAPGPVWTVADKVTRTGIRSPDRPTRTESLYPLRYPGPRKVVVIMTKYHYYYYYYYYYY
jgi:hypothetical protein